MSTQRFIRINGEQVSVSEEVYRAYKRPLWAERKQQERQKRCIGKNGNRCTEDCSKCPFSRSGGTLSIEQFAEDGVDIPDPSDIDEVIAYKLLLEQLGAALIELEPDERSLIDALFYKERAERDYATELGMSHQAVGKRKQKVLAKLREILDSRD